MPAPIVEVEKRLNRTRGQKRARGRWLSRVLFRRLVIALALVALIPLGLTLLYRVPFVHPISTLMIGDLVKLNGYDRRWLPMEDISTNLVHSVMMSEDGQFCSHFGVDWGEINAVINDALSGERPRGASTIPMQTAKNLFLWPGRSYVRKVIEVPLAVYMDLVTPKRRIMEIYLNIVEWGPGIYGAEAAAQHYFGRSARDLSRRQAALLAVTLPNPLARNPAKPGPGLTQLASIIERRAQRAGAYVGCID